MEFNVCSSQGRNACKLALIAKYGVFSVIAFSENGIYLAIMISRTLATALSERFFKGKAIVLVGARQVGKTTLLRSCLAGKEYLFINGDDPQVLETLQLAGVSKLKALIGKHNIIFIDEAQRIPNIGLTSKLIIDSFPEVQLLLSGSSALEIGNLTQEPLTGRKYAFNLYPISWQEFEASAGYLEADAQLEERLIYGMYPDVLNRRAESREILRLLAESYLFKDLLALTGIRRPDLLDKLLRALALQLGSEVSYNELAGLLEVDKGTVAKYIELLEKAFIVFRLSSFSGNMRNEIRNNRKIYFYDNGIRNMLINNLNPLQLRNDKGALWENFLISERIKTLSYHRVFPNHYFWRTVQQQEIDFIETIDGNVRAFEFKWKKSGKKHIPSAFLEKYHAQGTIIDRDNFREFVCFNSD
jgi:uncharacterized protein